MNRMLVKQLGDVCITYISQFPSWVSRNYFCSLMDCSFYLQAIKLPLVTVSFRRGQVLNNENSNFPQGNHL